MSNDVPADKQGRRSLNIHTRDGHHLIDLDGADDELLQQWVIRLASNLESITALLQERRAAGLDVTRIESAHRHQKTCLRILTGEQERRAKRARADAEATASQLPAGSSRQRLIIALSKALRERYGHAAELQVFREATALLCSIYPGADLRHAIGVPMTKHPLCTTLTLDVGAIPATSPEAAYAAMEYFQARVSNGRVTFHVRLDTPSPPPPNPDDPHEDTLNTYLLSLGANPGDAVTLIYEP